MIKCELCGDKTTNIDGMYDHIEEEHVESIPKNFTVAQYYYMLRTGKDHGNCVICKEHTTWNPATSKYNRFCDNPKCKDTYREEFRKRMIGKYGRVHLLNDPEQQKKMLSNRSISGEYTWSDGKKIGYTGTYEMDFLRFLDIFMNFDSEDIISPSPHTYYYIYEGEEKFYIPDFFIPSLNLEIEIKDGGDNPNTHHKIQGVDKVKEKLKDNVLMSQKRFNYIKIANKNYDPMFEFLHKLKDIFASKGEEQGHPIFIVKESFIPKEKGVVVEEKMSSYESGELEPVYVLLTHSGTFLSNAIKSVTNQPYSHASISFDSGLDNMHSFGRKFKNNPLIGTFVKESIRTGLYEDVAETATYSLYATFVTKKERDAMLEKLKYFQDNKDNFKYNFIGLIRHSLGLETHREDAYFCSEFVDVVLRSGKTYFDKHSSMIKPYDFAKHKEFNFVTKGLLKHYDVSKVDHVVDKLKQVYSN